MNHGRSLCACAILAVGAAASTSQAALMIESLGSASTEGTGAAFTGTIDYQFLGGTSGLLTVSLTNTTPGGVGGFLTAFVYNSDSSDGGASASLLTSTQPAMTDAAGESANPFGGAHLGGAGVNGGWEGGGPPSGGIAIGATGTFTFDIDASDAAILTDASFLEGPDTYNFVVRFRGLTDGGSDKVPAVEVPAPGAAGLALAAGLGVMGRRRRA